MDHFSTAASHPAVPPAGHFIRQFIQNDWQGMESLPSKLDYSHNVIVGTQLGGQSGPKVMPLPLNRNDRRIAWHEVGSPVRIIAVLRATIESRVPVGYEDETGFHYGRDTTGWPFSI